MKDVDGFPFEYALCFSTDHHSGDGGIWLYGCNGDPVESGNWKSYDRALAEGDFDFLENKPAGNPIFVDKIQGSRTETPRVKVVDCIVHMTYHNRGVGHNQSTLLATSKDGVNFARLMISISRENESISIGIFRNHAKLGARCFERRFRRMSMRDEVTISRKTACEGSGTGTVRISEMA